MNHTQEQALHAAVDWHVKFESGSITDRDKHAFEHWRHADPAHDMAWDRVNTLLHNSFSVVRDAGLRANGQVQAAQRALLNTRRRKMLSGALMFAGVGGVSALATNRQIPLGQLMADLSTGTGERKTFTLPDGSNVQLNARSAADTDFSQQQRKLFVREGDLIVNAKTDSRNPFIVSTDLGMMQTMGARFMVRRGDKASTVVALEQNLDIRTRDGQSARLMAGQGVTFNANGMTPVSGDALTLAAWSDGMLAIENSSLAEVVVALKPYYRGFIRVAPDVAALRVFGSFPLVDAPDVLRTLAHTLPLKMQQYGNWLIDIRHA